MKIALSSTEAEYLTLGSAVQERVWLRQLLSDTGVKQKDPTIKMRIIRELP